MRRIKLSKSDRQFWEEHGIDPGVPSDGSITTEQLGDLLLEQVKNVSPQEKAEFRKQLDAAFSPDARAHWRAKLRPTRLLSTKPN
jgi:hypothetical protein